MSDALHLRELLHLVAQGVLYPVMFILGALIIYALWCVGSLIVEAVVERRHYKVSMPVLIAAVDDSGYDNLMQVIEDSGLLRFQKMLLQTLIAYGYLPEDARVALAKRLLSDAELRYTRIVSRTDTVAKIAPMLGLMATLIPLGPGVVALGQGDVKTLGSSIEIAFDGTVAGLVVAAVSVVVSRFRKQWYEDYMVTLESVTSAILEKAQECTAANINIGNKEIAAQLAEQVKASRHKSRSKAEKKSDPFEIPASINDPAFETLMSEGRGA